MERAPRIGVGLSPSGVGRRHGDRAVQPRSPVSTSHRWYLLAFRPTALGCEFTVHESPRAGRAPARGGGEGVARGGRGVTRPFRCNHPNAVWTPRRLDKER